MDGDYEQQSARIRPLRAAGDYHLRKMTHSSRLVAVVPPKTSFYVRALVDYNAEKDRNIPCKGLSFKHGDILFVSNANDDQWWVAAKLDPRTSTLSPAALVPSWRRFDKREGRKLRSVKFSDKDGNDPTERKYSTLERKRLTGLLSKFSLSRSKEMDLNVSAASPSSKSTESLDLGSRPTFSAYERVRKLEVDYKRPIVIESPWKDRLKEDLVAQFKGKVTLCTPHTTRPKRPNETDGREYHFVTEEQMQSLIASNKMLEVGQYQSHLYGTCMTSVLEVMTSGRHPIVDISVESVSKLIERDVHPIVIYTKPASIKVIMETNKRMTQQQAASIFEKCQRKQKDFSHLFTTVTGGETYEDILSELVHAVQQQLSNNSVWLSSSADLFY